MEEKPSNVPNQGPIELQLLAIQKELSWIKNTYVQHEDSIIKMKADVSCLKDAYIILKQLGESIRKLTEDEY